MEGHHWAKRLRPRQAATPWAAGRACRGTAAAQVSGGSACKREAGGGIAPFKRGCIYLSKRANQHARIPRSNIAKWLSFKISSSHRQSIT